jgi:hypothetical protein
MSQADFSDYVVHFTKNERPWTLQHRPQDRQAETIAATSARDRLEAILKQRRILALRMPWTDCPAVCFTECTWPSLLRHCKEYSSYGIGFEKAKIFARGGGPAIYMRQDHFAAQKKSFASEVYPFVAPFVPQYAPPEHRAKYWKEDRPFPMDFTHQREWRLPAQMEFAFDDVAFIFLAIHADLDAMPQSARKALPPEKWIIVSNYQKIEELWPQHNIGDGV